MPLSTWLPGLETSLLAFAAIKPTARYSFDFSMPALTYAASATLRELAAADIALRWPPRRGSSGHQRYRAAPPNCFACDETFHQASGALRALLRLPHTALASRQGCDAGEAASMAPPSQYQVLPAISSS